MEHGGVRGLVKVGMIGWLQQRRQLYREMDLISPCTLLGCRKQCCSVDAKSALDFYGARGVRMQDRASQTSDTHKASPLRIWRC